MSTNIFRCGCKKKSTVCKTTKVIALNVDRNFQRNQDGGTREGCWELQAAVQLDEMWDWRAPFRILKSLSLIMFECLEHCHIKPISRLTLSMHTEGGINGEMIKK